MTLFELRLEDAAGRYADLAKSRPDPHPNPVPARGYHDPRDVAAGGLDWLSVNALEPHDADGDDIIVPVPLQDGDLAFRFFGTGVALVRGAALEKQEY